MKWYRLSCERCGWKASVAVDEGTLKRFLREVGEFCRDCLHNSNAKVKWTIKEEITNVLRGFTR